MQLEHRDILCSWLAVENDFDGRNRVNEMGPTVGIHAYHWIYKQHLLFYTRDYEKYALKMRNYLDKELGHKIKLFPVSINGVFTNLAQIKSSVEKILLRYQRQRLDFSLSMGTGAMKIAWYMIHASSKFDSRLTVIMPPELSENNFHPDYFEIQVEESDVPFNALIREKNLSRKNRTAKPFISTSLQKIYDKAYKIALADNVSVLLLGSTGTGKEILAKYIHRHSPRKNKPFVSINCSAFSDQLLESRLFGHKKGSFTDAISDFKGIFEQADGGTVFLDEIGDISPYMQQSLLRFLQEREIQPIGGKVKKVDTRIIAATNRNLLSLIEQNKFRADLFFRLGVSLKIPDFQTFDADEKEKWIKFLIDKKAKQFNRNKIQLSRKLTAFLLTYDFPGNIRELENIIDNFYVFAEQTADIEHLPEYAFNISDKNNFSENFSLEQLEKRHIINIITKTNGNKVKAAKLLGIAYNTLVAKMNKYDIK